jgi:hypothetical protein
MGRCGAALADPHGSSATGSGGSVIREAALAIKGNLVASGVRSCSPLQNPS